MSLRLDTPDQVKEIVAAGAQLVEVLPAKEYREQHIPQATNIPLRELDERASELDRDRPVVVYCWDSACDLSPRAAERLLQLGFTQVYDYVPGKLDWLAHGLPIEGSLASEPTAGSVADREAPTCRLDERVSEITAPYCAVVDDRRVVHGAIRRSDLGEGDDRTAEEAMRRGPSTFRPNVSIAELADYMDANDLDHAPITTSDGVLIGTITIDEARAASPSSSRAREQAAGGDR